MFYYQFDWVGKDTFYLHCNGASNASFCWIVIYFNVKCLDKRFCCIFATSTGGFEHFSKKDIKGEIVIVLEGAVAPLADDDSEE